MSERTCLYEQHLKYHGKMVDFAGFELPIQYEAGIMAEHEATRERIGLFDVSHMGKFNLDGVGAMEVINHLVTNDISQLVDGQAAYSPMCYEDGGTVDDVLVYRKSGTSFLLVVNAANKVKDYQWVEDHLIEGVRLMDITPTLCQIAVQGPKAVELIQSLTTADVTAIPYYHFRSDVNIAGIPTLVSRTGYTGEDGFELYFSEQEAGTMWEQLIQHGQPFGLLPCGLGARDTLRFEAGMPLYGNELSDAINPIEAGLNFFIKLDKDDFIGKTALMTYKTDQIRKMVGFELLDKGIARHGTEVISDTGEVIGHVTTGYKSPTFGATIGVALVPYGYNNSHLTLKVRNKTLNAKIIKKRFLKTYEPSK